MGFLIKPANKRKLVKNEARLRAAYAKLSKQRQEEVESLVNDEDDELMNSIDALNDSFDEQLNDEEV
jgi:hypothetical protein